jgi:hypothetical protein
MPVLIEPPVTVFGIQLRPIKLSLCLSTGDQEASPVLKLASFFVGAVACFTYKERKFK